MKTKMKTWIVGLVLSAIFPSSVFADDLLAGHNENVQKIFGYGQGVREIFHTCSMHREAADMLYDERRKGKSSKEIATFLRKTWPQGDIEVYAGPIANRVYQFTPEEFNNITKEEWVEFVTYECQAPRFKELEAQINQDFPPLY